MGSNFIDKNDAGFPCSGSRIAISGGNSAPAFQLQCSIIELPWNNAVTFYPDHEAWHEAENVDLWIAIAHEIKGPAPKHTAVLALGDHAPNAFKDSLLIENLPMDAPLDVLSERIQALCGLGRMLRQMEELDAHESSNQSATGNFLQENETLAVVQALAFAGESRDNTTQDHPLRVGRLTALIADSMGMPTEDVNLLKHAATLHDLGKVSIPDSILEKKGPLTPTEFETVKKHTTVGARMFSRFKSPFFRMAHDIALNHHESWDGTGYPHKTKGEAIPVMARIAAVADVFDALMTSRPYKPAWPMRDAVEEIQSLAGRKFDRQVVEAFTNLANQEVLSLLYREDGSAAKRAAGGHYKTIS